MKLVKVKVYTDLNNVVKSTMTKVILKVSTMVYQLKNKLGIFCKGATTPEGDLFARRALRALWTLCSLFIFILGISFPSLLSIPSKSRESGGVLIGTSEYHKEVQCLTEAAYHEAANQPEEGIRAVLQVIKNRKEAKGFPSSFCGVVQQPKQFSYRNDLQPGQMKPIKIKNSLDKEVLQKIHYLSELTAQGTLRNDLPEGTLYYAHKKVKNSWTRKFERVKVIHQHVFYKEI